MNGCKKILSTVSLLALSIGLLAADNTTPATQTSSGCLNSASELVKEFRNTQGAWIYIIPPGKTTIRVSHDLQYFNTIGFSKEGWFKKLIPTIGKGYHVYNFSLVEDKATRSVVVRDAKGIQVGSIPPVTGYDSAWLAKLVYPDLYGGKYSSQEIADILVRCDPSRIEVMFSLVPQREMTAYLADKTQVTIGTVKSPDGMSLMMDAMSYTTFSDPSNSNHLKMNIWSLDSTSVVVDVEAATSFTNHVAIVNTPTLLPTNWTVVVSNLVQNNGLISWTNRNVLSSNVGFYACFDSDVRALTDGDNDGLTTGVELFLKGSNPTNSDSDYDGFGDGIEDVCGTGLTNSNSVPVIVTFSPSSVVVLTNRTYSAGYYAHLQPMTACTTAIPIAIVNRMAATSTCSTVAQVVGRSQTGSNIYYNIQTGTNGIAYVQGMFGPVTYGSQIVYSASARFNDNVVRLGLSGPSPNPDWYNESPQFSPAAETRTNVLAVIPQYARSSLVPTNNNTSVCRVTSLDSTGLAVQAYNPGVANVSVMLNGLLASSFSADVVQVYFPDRVMTILTNDTRALTISVNPLSAVTNIWTTNRNTSVAQLNRTVNGSSVSWSVKGLTPGTTYIDTGYGAKPTDRIRIDVVNMVTDSTNLTMAVDPANPASTYDWCKITVGTPGTLYDSLWTNDLEIITVPTGVVTACFLTNALPTPEFKLLLTPAVNAGGCATVKLRLRPTTLNGNATNEYARLTANVVKVRPFTNILYVAKNGSGKLTLTEANVPRGGWTCDPAYNYPGPNPDLTLNWDGFGSREYRWVIEKQWCYDHYPPLPDINARYNPTCMVYFCDFAFTNSPWMQKGGANIPFTPSTWLPLAGASNLPNHSLSLRQVSGAGSVQLKVGTQWYSFDGTNPVYLSGPLVSSTEPYFDNPSVNARVLRLPGELRGTGAGTVNLEYRHSTSKGDLACSTVTVTVVDLGVQVDWNRDGVINSADNTTDPHFLLVDDTNRVLCRLSVQPSDVGSGTMYFWSSQSDAIVWYSSVTGGTANSGPLSWDLQNVTVATTNIYLVGSHYGNCVLNLDYFRTGQPWLFRTSTNATVFELDLDTDSNNDSSIDATNEGEDKYEAYPPGRIICKSYDGDDTNAHPFAMFTLTARPTVPGMVVDLAVEAATNVVNLYKYSDYTTPIGSGGNTQSASWTMGTDSIPLMFFASPTNEGTANIRLRLKTGSGQVLARDDAAITVTKTVSWSPGGTYVHIWEPSPWPNNNTDTNLVYPGLGNVGIQYFKVVVTNQGWDTEQRHYTTINYSWPSTNLNNCTLANFKAMKNSGFNVIESHADPYGVVAAFFTSPAMAAAWMNGETNMSVIQWTAWSNTWYVYVDKAWFGANWKPTLDTSRSIVYWMGCNSGGDNVTNENSLAATTGGRTRLGYSTVTCNAAIVDDAPGIFGRMSGVDPVDHGTKRSLAEAWKEGGYDNTLLNTNFNIVSFGNRWTTLCPSVVSYLPTNSPGARKGFGCVVFDTYMDCTVPASSVLVKDSGSCVISNVRWLNNPYGQYAIGFDFDNTSGSGATMRLVATNALNTGTIAVGTAERQVDPDRVAPNAHDWPWSF